MKKVSAVHVLAIVLSLMYSLASLEMPALATGTGYPDVKKDQWFYESVLQSTAIGLFSGYPSGYFGPDDDVTRGQAVQVLYNYYGSDMGTRSGFSDVSEEDWYAKAITWASKNSLVNGVGNSTFAPGSSLTREQLVSILYAKAGRPTVNANRVLGRYVDYKDVSSWAREAMAWAVECGVIQGGAGNRLLPQGVATRAQMATIMIRYISTVDGETIPSVGI